MYECGYVSVLPCHSVRSISFLYLELFVRALSLILFNIHCTACCGSIVSQWFQFCFPLALGMPITVMNDNEFETKRNQMGSICR